MCFRKPSYTDFILTLKNEISQLFLLQNPVSSCKADTQNLFLFFFKRHTFRLIAATRRRSRDIDLLCMADAVLVVHAVCRLAADIRLRAGTATLHRIFCAVAASSLKTLTARILADPRIRAANLNISSAAIHCVVVYTTLCGTNQTRHIRTSFISSPDDSGRIFRFAEPAAKTGSATGDSVHRERGIYSRHLSNRSKKECRIYKICNFSRISSSNSFAPGHLSLTFSQLSSKCNTNLLYTDTFFFFPGTLIS